MADVFVSYAQEDRARVERLVAAIEHAGLEVWFDTRLRPGQSFDEVIAAELERARVVLVVWSAASVKSRWVRDEAQVGADRDVLVPVSADGTPPPLGFRQFQSLDMRGWRGGETPALRIVLDELGARAGRAAAEAQAARPAPRRRGHWPLAAGLAAVAAIGAVAGWLVLRPAPQIHDDAPHAQGETPAGAPVAGADEAQLAALPCSLLLAREGGRAIDGVYGAGHAPALPAATGGDGPDVRAVSLPDAFCPVLDALRARALAGFAASWIAPRAEIATAHQGGEPVRAIQLSVPMDGLDPADVVYVLAVGPRRVETLMILNQGAFEGQTRGDVPQPAALPPQGVFTRTIVRERPPEPELALFLALDRRVPELEDALDRLTPGDNSQLAALLGGPDAPTVRAARLIVLDRGFVDPPGFAAEPAPERKVRALYDWLQTNRPGWFRAPPLPSPYGFAAAAFAPDITEAIYADAEGGEGPFSAADILFADLVPRGAGAGDLPFEGRLTVAEVMLAGNDGATAQVRAIVGSNAPGAPASRRTVDLTLTRQGGLWLITDAQWPDREASALIPRGASLRDLLKAHLARLSDDLEDQPLTND